MKKKIYLLPVIIFSLLIIGATPYTLRKSQGNFNNIENTIIEKGDFTQNGVRVEYCLNSSIEDEHARILEKLKQYFGNNLHLNYNEISYKNSEREINTNIWMEENKVKVQISYFNNVSSKSSEQMKNELVKIQNNKGTKVKYFNFIKGKITNDSRAYIQDVLKSNIKQDTLKTLNIHNGYVAKAQLNDNQRVNIGYMRYDTGEYLIIGTPMIFITY
ncbi:hypothetical protein JCM1393_16900 [Clostridium carnis]